MLDIHERLDKILDLIQGESFLAGKGLGNDIGFYIFDYDPKEELVVRDHVKFLKDKLNTNTSPTKIIEFDLYELLLGILKSESVLEQIANLEAERGSEYILEAIRDLASPEVYVSLIDGKTEESQIVFLTGIGKVWPIVRSHNILNNLHHILENIPVVMFFPGIFDGTGLRLFGKIDDDNYYRAFPLVAK